MTTQLLVVMDAQHVIYVGSKKAIVDFDSLKSYLQDEILKLQKQYGNVNPTVVVSVDRLAEYGSFLRLFSIVQDCSQRLRLAYTPIEEPEE